MEECEGEEDNSGGGIAKPIVKSEMQRLRSDIPEMSVLDDDDGIGRGAEVAVVVTGPAGLLLVGGAGDAVGGATGGATGGRAAGAGGVRVGE